MRRIDWIIAAVFILSGIICLSLAPTVMMGRGSFIHSLCFVLLWIVFPLASIWGLFGAKRRKK